MAKKNRWFIPTNLDNLSIIIAQGLISSPDGFEVYYSDVMDLIPGFIPIFKNRIAPNILQSVLVEEDGLVPCIIEINIDMIYGTVKNIENNMLVNIAIEDIEEISSEVLFIQAPLPLAVMSKVIFRTSNEKSAFEKDAALYSNVPLGSLPLHYTKTDQKLFMARGEVTDKSIATFKNIDIIDVVSSCEYQKIYALGGLLLNLFYFSKNGQDSHNALMNVVEGKSDLHNDESIILDYFYNKHTDNEVGINQLLYNGLVKVAIEEDDFKEGIITFLNSIEKAHSIAKKMMDFESGSDKPVSEYFKEAKTRYGRALLMLFVREDSESLIDYELDVFDEHDYLVLAMLFGIRDKFHGIPKFIREFDGLQSYVSVKMANYAHEMMGSPIKFKEPKVPLTLIAMLKNNRFKEYIAKELKMEQCFETTIPAIDYRVVKGKPVLPGIVMPKFEILEDAYFDFMSKYKLTEYNTFLKKYEKIK